MKKIRDTAGKSGQTQSFWNLSRVLRAGGYSLAGLRRAAAGEAAFKQEIFLFLVLAPTGALLGHSGMERALLIGSLFLVLIVELLNTAIETVVDRFGPERHPLSGYAKDLGSAAVLLSLVNGLLVWALILWPRG